MAILPILIYPDSKLKKVACDVPDVDDTIRTLGRDMLETMYNAPGIGLAAPQIGVGLRMLVMDCTAHDEDPDPRILINPVILEQSSEIETDSEGCLSIPGLTADVGRPCAIGVSFLDVEGVMQKEQFEGLWARCLQHEIDHLDGKLFVDHLSRLKRQVLLRRFMREYHQNRAQSRPSGVRTP